MAKFIIFALPRSRTKWVSEWLSFGGRYAIGHDLTVDCSSIADFEDALDAVDGTVETGAILGWRLLLARHPELRVATISRPVWQIVASLQAQGWYGVDEVDMVMRAEMLHALSLQRGVQNFTFAGLSSEAECARLWEFALARDFDFEHWIELAPQNIQINMAERISRLRGNQLGLLAFKNELVAEMAKGGAAWGLN